MTDTDPVELSELDLARLQERLRPLTRPERRHKTTSELSTAEHVERITAERAGRAWTPPLTDEAIAYERQVAAAAGLPDPHAQRSLEDMTVEDHFNRINRR